MLRKLKYLIRFAVLFTLSISCYAVTCDNENTAVPATTAHLRLNPNDAREVIDQMTGLVWQRCNIGQTWDGATCSGSALAMTWPSAIAVANETGEEWRLPNIKELYSIVEHRCYLPAINGEFFPNTPRTTGGLSDDDWWTSSPRQDLGSRFAGVDDIVWVVSFARWGAVSTSRIANSFGDEQYGYVRLVRSIK